MWHTHKSNGESSSTPVTIRYKVIKTAWNNLFGGHGEELYHTLEISYAEIDVPDDGALMVCHYFQRCRK